MNNGDVYEIDLTPDLGRVLKEGETTIWKNVRNYYNLFIDNIEDEPDGLEELKREIIPRCPKRKIDSSIGKPALDTSKPEPYPLIFPESAECKFLYQCPRCKKPVYLRRGIKYRAHFTHKIGDDKIYCQYYNKGTISINYYGHRGKNSQITD